MCDTDRIHEGAASWPFYVFMEGSSTATLNARVFVKSTSSSNTPGARERILRTYHEAVNHLVQSYAADVVITEANAALPWIARRRLCRWHTTQERRRLNHLGTERFTMSMS